MTRNGINGGDDDAKDDEPFFSLLLFSDFLHRLIYQEGNFPDKPEVIFGDGDGTVNIRSAKVCESVSCGISFMNNIFTE